MNKHRNYLIENQPAENNELNRNNSIQKCVNKINITKDNTDTMDCSDKSNNAGGTKRTRNTLRLSKTKYSRNKKTRNKKHEIKKPLGPVGDHNEPYFP